MGSNETTWHIITMGNGEPFLGFGGRLSLFPSGQAAQAVADDYSKMGRLSDIAPFRTETVRMIRAGDNKS